MLTHLEIENFQSIVKADLELRPFTLITGPNFSGKSATLRALRNLVFNRRGDEFIRHGQDETQVNVALADGDSVLWHKVRGSSADYTLRRSTGVRQNWLKTGTDVPDDVRQVLDIRRLDIDSNFSVTPQFIMQWDIPLVAESGSRMARILGAMTKLDRVVRAQIACRKDRDRERRQVESEEQLSTDLQQQLDGLSWVPELRQKVTGLKEPVETARRAIIQIEQAEPIQVRLTFLEGVKSYAHLLPGLTLADEILQTIGPAEVIQAKLERLDKVRSFAELLPNLEAVDDGLTLLRAAKTTLSMLDRVEASIEASSESLQQAQEARAAAQKEYEDECSKRGVCEDCPWR